MGKLLITSALVIHCLAHSGYRRAGVGFVKGENHFKANTFTESQLVQLEADPRLKVVHADEQAGQADQSTLSQGPLASTAVDGGLSTGLSFSDAIAQLTPNDKAHFTAGGKPQCDALSQLMGNAVTAGERDALWADYQAAQQQSEGAE